MTKSYIYNKVDADTRHRKKAIEVQNYIDGKMKDFEHGVNPEDIIRDTRSTTEKLQDTDQLNEKFYNDVYNLFNHDTQFTEDFMNHYKRAGYDISLFALIYPELIQRFKGKLVYPNTVFNVMQKLLQNLNSSGTTNPGFNKTEMRQSFSDLIYFLNNQYKQGILSKQKGDDMADKVNAIETLLYANDTGNESISGNRNAAGIKTKITQKYTEELLDLLTLSQQNEHDTNKLQDLYNILKNIKKTTLIELQKNR